MHDPYVPRQICSGTIVEWILAAQFNNRTDREGMMSTRMLRRSVLVIMMVFAAGATMAQDAAAQIQSPEGRYAGQFDRLMKRMDVDAHRDIPGIVESTIYNLVQCKSVFPDKGYARFVRWLDETAATYPDAAIAYKATIASLYLRYGSPITDASVFDPNDHEKAFKTIAAQLATKLLATNTQ
jgi:hypothetical protein